MSLFREIGRRVEQFKQDVESTADKHTRDECPECGQPLAENQTTCPNCGAEIASDD
jgi:predicted amidophosphoribosyltransferase